MAFHLRLPISFFPSNGFRQHFGNSSIHFSAVESSRATLCVQVEGVCHCHNKPEFNGGREISRITRNEMKSALANGFAEIAGREKYLIGTCCHSYRVVLHFFFSSQQRDCFFISSSHQLQLWQRVETKCTCGAFYSFTALQYRADCARYVVKSFSKDFDASP